MNSPVELPQARTVCPTSTQRLLAQGALLVDVRERAEVDGLAFGVPGVIALPLSEFEQRFAELPRDRELVLACQGGIRSLKATYFLLYQGFTRVANMEGGIMKWAAKGFPIRGAAGRTPGTAAGCCGSAASPDAAASTGCCGGGRQASPAASCCGSSTGGGESDRCC